MLLVIPTHDHEFINFENYLLLKLSEFVVGFLATIQGVMFTLTDFAILSRIPGRHVHIRSNALTETEHAHTNQRKV